MNTGGREAFRLSYLIISRLKPAQCLTNYGEKHRIKKAKIYRKLYEI